MPLLFAVLVGWSSAAADETITIDIWYGSEQTINSQCLTQQYFNVLGNVRSENEITSLTYMLNGGEAVPIEVGPNLFRLANPGDFNVDLDLNNLQPGANEVIISAADSTGTTASQTVVVRFENGGAPDLSQTQMISWTPEDLASGRAVVIDGYWELTADGLTNSETGYDRLVGICPMNWQNFEITVPVTIHVIEPRKEWPSNGSGVGIAFHWNGHEKWNDIQPQYGWHPIGGFNILSWDYTGERAEPIEAILLNGDEYLPLDQQLTEIKIGETYLFKLRSEHVPGLGSYYKSKVWPAGENEPSQWMLIGHQYQWRPYFGSILLVSHHTEATFGTVEITNLSSPMNELLNLLPFLALLPLLALGFYALYVARSAKNKMSGALHKSLVAAGLASILFAVGKPVLDLFMPPVMHSNNFGFKAISVALTAGNLLLVTFLAVGLGLLLFNFVKGLQR